MKLTRSGLVCLLASTEPMLQGDREEQYHDGKKVHANEDPMPESRLEVNDERVLLARERTLLASERNRLANERTFLAWIRTGLACVGGGLAIMHFLTFHNLKDQLIGQVIGSIFVVLGIALFALSLFDYRRSFQTLKIKEGYVGKMFTMSLICLTLITISLILLFIAFRTETLTELANYYHP